MRFMDGLARYNRVIAALLLSWGLIGAAIITWQFTSDLWARNHVELNKAVPPQTERRDAAEDFSTIRGKVVLHKIGADDGEGFRALRFIAMDNGQVADFSPDARQIVYRGQKVPALGYLALVRTGALAGEPVFDCIFLRFSDFKRTVVASGVVAMDAVTVLSGQRISLLLWERGDTGSYAVFDIERGELSQRTPVVLKPNAEGSVTQADSAPVNKYH